MLDAFLNSFTLSLIMFKGFSLRLDPVKDTFKDVFFEFNSAAKRFKVSFTSFKLSWHMLEAV